MPPKYKIRPSRILIILIVVLGSIFSVLFYYREPIKEHKVTKAKMEMFRRMLKSEPEDWAGEFNEVIDSMILNPSDSIGQQLKN